MTLTDVALPRALLLDMDDTILSFAVPAAACWPPICARFAPAAGLAPEALVQAIAAVSAWYWPDRARDLRGRLNPLLARSEVVTLALERLGADVPGLAAEMAAAYSPLLDETIQPLPGAIETLRRLRASGRRLALVTNSDGAGQRRKIERFALAPLFDCILVEGELGFGKPDERIYRQALAQLAAQPTEAWMVGDNLEYDVEAPQRLGMRGIWVDWRGKGLPPDSRARPDRIVRSLAELLEPQP